MRLGLILVVHFLTSQGTYVHTYNYVIDLSVLHIILLVHILSIRITCATV